MARHAVSAASSIPIEGSIRILRGHRVLLDQDLARLYGVQTRVLVQAVRRNLGRFPEDFMFQLTTAEFAALRSQTVISNVGRGGRRYPPYAFTEQGVAMLSSVLNSARAIQVNIAIVRVFVRLRAAMASHAELSRRLDELEARHDRRFRVVFEPIRELMRPTPSRRRRRIGFTPPRVSPATAIGR